MTNRRRLLVLLSGGLVAALLAGFLLWPRAPAPLPAAEKSAPPPAPAAASAPASRQVVPERDMALTQQKMTDPVEVAGYLERFKEANRYAPGTVKLLAGMKDVLEPDVLPARDVPVMGVRNLFTKPEYRLYSRFEADKLRYVAPAPIQLRLTVFRGETKHEPVAVKVGPVEVHRLQPTGRRTNLGTVALVEKKPGEYTASWLPPTRQGAQEDDVLQLEVAWELPGDSQPPTRERTVVQYTSLPPAFFTGRFLETLEKGSLLIDAEVESEREGEAQVSANLFAADGTTPVALSSASARLKRGRSWVRWEFYGLVFHDQGLPGPYVLKTLRGHLVSSASSGRGAEFTPFEGTHPTRAYALSDFTSAEWDSPQKQAGLKAYEEELARLRAAPPTRP